MRVKTKGNDGGESDQTILKWVGRNGLDSFFERDLNRNFPRFSERPKELRAALGCPRGRDLLHSFAGLGMKIG
jgi:hypothetical protein